MEIVIDVDYREHVPKEHGSEWCLLEDHLVVHRDRDFEYLIVE